MANPKKGSVVRLTAERLRRLERGMAALDRAQRAISQRLDKTSTRVEHSNVRLEQVVDVLTRLVRVVAVQHGRGKESFARVTGRVDKLTQAVTRGRTADAQHLSRLERRMDVLARRVDRRSAAS